MPRIIYIVFFVLLTLLPFPFIWIGQAFLNLQSPNTNPTNRTYTSYHSHPYFGGFFYYGDHGRGGWLGRSYRNFGGSSNGIQGSSRSYSGGSSSFSGGSFGAFGK